MQITNQIKDYAKLLLTEQVVFFFAVVFFLLVFHWNEFRYMYYAKLFSVVGISLAGVYLCRRLLRPRFYPLKQVLAEAGENLLVGSASWAGFEDGYAGRPADVWHFHC